MAGKNPGSRPEETHEGRLGRIERARNGRSGEEGRTSKEGGCNVPITLLPKLKYATTVLPLFLKCAGLYFLFFFSQCRRGSFLFVLCRRKSLVYFIFIFLFTFHWKAIKIKTNQVIFIITYLNNKEVNILTFREATFSRLN